MKRENRSGGTTVHWSTRAISKRGPGLGSTRFNSPTPCNYLLFTPAAAAAGAAATTATAGLGHIACFAFNTKERATRSVQLILFVEFWIFLLLNLVFLRHQGLGSFAPGMGVYALLLPRSSLLLCPIGQKEWHIMFAMWKKEFVFGSTQ